MLLENFVYIHSMLHLHFAFRASKLHVAVYDVHSRWIGVNFYHYRIGEKTICPIMEKASGNEWAFGWSYEKVGRKCRWYFGYGSLSARSKKSLDCGELFFWYLLYFFILKPHLNIVCVVFNNIIFHDDTELKKNIFIIYLLKRISLT